jgi:hypothetical protein
MAASRRTRLGVAAFAGFLARIPLVRLVRLVAPTPA